jgi:hypothetical protein
MNKDNYDFTVIDTLHADGCYEFQLQRPDGAVTVRRIYVRPVNDKERIHTERTLRLFDTKNWTVLVQPPEHPQQTEKRQGQVRLVADGYQEWLRKRRQLKGLHIRVKGREALLAGTILEYLQEMKTAAAPRKAT